MPFLYSMKGKGKKISIDVLMESTGGDLVFKKVKANKHDLKKMVDVDKNPVIKHNVFKAGSEKKVKV